MTAVPEKKTTKKQEARPQIFWQMLESRIWTNRLDQELQARLKQLKEWAFDLESKLQAVIPNVEPENQEILRQIEKENLEIIQGLVPDLFKFYVKASENSQALDSDIIQLKKYNHELENLSLSKLEMKLRKKLQGLKNKLGAVTSEPKVEYQEVELMPHDPKFTRFANVDNEGTPLNAFDKWVTVFHHNGKRYGSSTPAVSDSVPKIITLDSVFPIKDKNVIEFGSFEGANTKQIADHGAKSVIGVEANPEFFAKSLVIKEFFKLNNVNFLFGNCVELIQNNAKIKDKKFDLCFIAGILYHMEDPLELIELASNLSDNIYVWTQVADDTFPKNAWSTIKDSKGNEYAGKRNVYTEDQKWGGISTGAMWLKPEEMKKAFENQGYKINNYNTERTGTGQAIWFLAQK